jgi:phosphoglycerate-specific signal transduction histidine kinase
VLTPLSLVVALALATPFTTARVSSVLLGLGCGFAIAQFVLRQLHGPLFITG